MRIITKLFVGFSLLGSLIIFYWGIPHVNAQAEFDHSKIKTGLQPDTLELLETIPLKITKRSIRGLPASFDISDQMPPIGNQQAQNSCVGWATTYAIKSFHEKRKHNWSFGKHPQEGGDGAHYFSPAWTYNQINGGKDNGSSYYYALKLLQQKGAVSWKKMPYSSKDYLAQPSSSMHREALNNRIKGLTRLDVANPSSIKEEIAKGMPVLTGVLTHRNFFRVGKGIVDHNNQELGGGHAIVFVGYDDNKSSPKGHRGAFRIMNSWGKGWGDQGYGWISYRHFSKIAQVAYAIQDSDQQKPDLLDQTIAATADINATQGSFTDRIEISWQAVSGALAYQLQRKAGNGSSYYDLANAQSTNYNDTAIQPGMSYNYRIITIGEKNRSAAEDSPIAQGYALKEKNQLPSKVLNLQAKYTGSSSKPQVSLTWQQASFAKTYRVLRWSFSRNSWQVLDTSKHQYFTDKRPLVDKTNYYLVRAENRSEHGAWSDMVQITVSIKQQGPPDNVTSLQVSQGDYDDKISLSWNKIGSASSYIIYRWDLATENWDQTFTTNETSLNDTTKKALSGNVYIYVVKAKNSYGLSNKWSPFEGGFISPARRGGGIAAPVPQNFKGVIDQEKKTVLFTWEAVKGAQGYHLIRRDEHTKQFTIVKEISALKKKFVSKLTSKPGEIIFFSLRSIGTLGAESANSNLIATFINEEPVTPRTIFNAAEGLKNFEGTWKATHWRPNNELIEVKLTITAKQNHFLLKAHYLNSIKKFTGHYAAKSRFLQTRDLSFELLEVFDNDIAKVNITAGALTKHKLQLNFERVKKL